MAAPPFDMLDEIQEQLLQRCLWISTELIERMMGSDGRVYGDTLPSRSDRIARFVDLADRGVLDILQTISPPTYKQLVAEFQRDVRNSELFT